MSDQSASPDVDSSAEQSTELGHSLDDEYRAFLERYEGRPSDTDVKTRFYYDDLSGNVMELRTMLTGDTVILREPTILSDADDESDEPDPGNTPYRFELGIVGEGTRRREWTLRLNNDFTYETWSRRGFSPEIIADTALRTLRDLS